MGGSQIRKRVFIGCPCSTIRSPRLVPCNGENIYEAGEPCTMYIVYNSRVGKEAGREVMGREERRWGGRYGKD